MVCPVLPLLHKYDVPPAGAYSVTVSPLHTDDKPVISPVCSGITAKVCVLVIGQPEAVVTVTDTSVSSSAGVNVRVALPLLNVPILLHAYVLPLAAPLTVTDISSPEQTLSLSPEIVSVGMALTVMV